jgi:hypothetical protein
MNPFATIKCSHKKCNNFQMWHKMFCIRGSEQRVCRDFFFGMSTDKKLNPALSRNADDAEMISMFESEMNGVSA